MQRWIPNEQRGRGPDPAKNSHHISPLPKPCCAGRRSRLSRRFRGGERDSEGPFLSLSPLSRLLVPGCSRMREGKQITTSDSLGLPSGVRSFPLPPGDKNDRKEAREGVPAPLSLPFPGPFVPPPRLGGLPGCARSVPANPSSHCLPWHIWRPCLATWGSSRSPGPLSQATVLVVRPRTPRRSGAPSDRGETRPRPGRRRRRPPPGQQRREKNRQRRSGKGK